MVHVLKNSYCSSTVQGSKLTLANSQNASDFDKLGVRKIFTSTRLRVDSSMSPKHLKNFASGLTSLLVEKIFLDKLCKRTEKLTSSPR